MFMVKMNKYPGAWNENTNPLQDQKLRPTILYGYGGFNISLTPSFNPMMMLFLKNFGGMFCVANIRGGGEYGQKWHQQGIKENKQNVIDDFIAAAEHLIENNYTDPENLII